MNIVLFRFEKELIHYLECVITQTDLHINKKEKIPLTSSKSRGGRYQQIHHDLRDIKSSCVFDSFAYQAPQKYRGSIKDEESFANTCILHLFCEQHHIELLELTPPTVRDTLVIAHKDFKLRLETEKKRIVENHAITKSDKLLDGLILLSLLKQR